MDKIVDGQEGEKLKNLPESETGNQEEVENKCLIEELPPEMLLKILKYLNVKSLAVSRLLNRKWNGMAREILQSRNDVETVFYCRKIEDGKPKIEEPSAGLENFIELFKDSKERPLYTRFRFVDMTELVFVHSDWLKFISDLGKNVKSLKLEVLVDNFDDVMELVEKLRNLLLNQLPNLQEFGLTLPVDEQPDVTPHPREIQLFPTTTTTSSNEKTAIQLPHLKVLHLDEDSFSDYTGIVTDLLNASVNLQKIEPFGKYDYSYANINLFQLLQSLGKLACIQNASINMTIEFLHQLKEMSLVSWAFKLKRLTLLVRFFDLKYPWTEASDFISSLFLSSKDTLRELTIDSLGFLPELKLPKFNKLTTLSIFKLDEKKAFLPSGTALEEIFPALQHLKLEMPWPDFFPPDENPDQNVSSLPNLKTLEMSGRGMTKDDIARISQVCPKLRTFVINPDLYGGPIENFPEVGTAIWTHLTRLESLDLKINTRSDAFPAVDSCFTGFSGEDVIRLYDLIENETCAKNPGFQVNIPQSEAEMMTAEIKSPSILNLQDLKSLTVSLVYFNQSYFVKSEPVPYKKTFAVSNKFAFQLMENLSYEAKCSVKKWNGGVNIVSCYHGDVK